jgi:hypothetical protein
MSHRPIARKRAAKMRKVIERQTPETSIDLIQWLKDRRYARTTGEAKRLILAKRVVSESHPLGIGKEPKLVKEDGTEIRRFENYDGPVKVELVDAVAPVVPASVRGTLRVLPEAE